MTFSDNKDNLEDHVIAIIATMECPDNPHPETLVINDLLGSPDSCLVSLKINNSVHGSIWVSLVSCALTEDSAFLAAKEDITEAELHTVISEGMLGIYRRIESINPTAYDSRIVFFRNVTEREAQRAFMDLSNYLDLSFIQMPGTYNEKSFKALSAMISFCVGEIITTEEMKGIQALPDKIFTTELFYPIKSKQDGSHEYVNSFDTTTFDNEKRVSNMDPKNKKENTNKKPNYGVDQSVYASTIVENFPEGDCIKIVRAEKGLRHLHYLSGYEREYRFIMQQHFSECIHYPKDHINLVYYVNKDHIPPSSFGYYSRKFDKKISPIKDGFYPAGYISAFWHRDEEIVNGFSVDVHYLQIISMAVDPSYRRKGIGRYLLSALKTFELPIVCDISEENLPTQLLLKDQGFSCTEMFDLQTDEDILPNVPKDSACTAKELANYDIPPGSMLRFDYQQEGLSIETDVAPPEKRFGSTHS